MPNNLEDSRFEIIERLVSYVIERLPEEEVPLVRQFIRHYYLSVSAEDLTSKGILDLYGAVISHWNYIAQRKLGEIKVRVYNPQLEQHGWQSTHTIIEIAYDDMPFLVDSVTMELNRMELNIHLIIHMGSFRFRRDAEGNVVEVLEYNPKDTGIPSEAAIYIEIDRQSDPHVLAKIEENVRRVLNDVHIIVQDWPKMRSEALKVLEEVRGYASFVEKKVLDESAAFIHWLIEDHYTFMGYMEYQLDQSEGSPVLKMVEGSGLGMLTDPPLMVKTILLDELPVEARERLLSEEILITDKTNIRSKVHRPAYIDFVAIKKFDSDGTLVGIKRFFGLYTAVAYNSSPRQIPYLRQKVELVLAHAGFIPRSHDDRALLNILETLPRDDLFQASVSELLSLATNILHLQERQRIRLFVRKDVFGYFFSCLIFVPRDTYNSTLRGKFQEILMKGFNGEEVEFSTRFSESSLARIHFIIRVNPATLISYDISTLEKKLMEAGRTWKDDLREALVEHCGEEAGNDLFKKYGFAFPAGYSETFSARSAVIDIEYFEALSELTPLGMSLYRNIEDLPDTIRFKLFRSHATIPLSDVVPILEKMGLRIISERPYELILKDNNTIWINDYRMIHPKNEHFDIETVRETFQEAFDNVWRGKAENDSLNRLVLTAKLNWREISVLRAYSKYLWQAGFGFSQTAVEDTLVINYRITTQLVGLFEMRFNPYVQAPETEQLLKKQKIEEELENVSSLNEDRILRKYLEVVLATVRTNYYQLTKEGDSKPYFSFKIESAKVPELPLPVPLYEIFVYSPRVEAIHLRVAKVARGGIRWSDRKDDFRTEILDLMKTQQVKNAVIVPMGAKGGFVVKSIPEHATREQIQDEVVFCYQTLICGLLDLTDNLKQEEIYPPLNVIRYDDDDPYLVVAADKGTASFSDIANAISKEYDFWLGDAFASGGSSGYDHKKMAITARGAWESVKQHFRELNFDTQTTDFTVFGIGDMAGDVFGNGMLLSRHIKLIAAFNHLDIFLDPNPTPETSFIERERLFNLPRSSWMDYNPALISKGGGVYSRQAKSIVLSPEIQKALGFYKDRVVPNELIRAILKAPVDLFWNGGIGTYVKATQETNAMVGDRANDALRINGAELRCKVVGEGGNLGFTQLGRVEYAKLGGLLNTDAIDNSGGVNCSDNEVNIKILLNDVIEKGDLTLKQRNELLVEMQNEVAELVLINNRRQPAAISVTVSQAAANLEMHSRLIQSLERSGNLNRQIEFLPDAEEIAARKALHQGLTRPEVAVLMAYTKILLKKSLLNSELPEDPAFECDLEDSFPKALRQRFKAAMLRHRLKREIIATRISNVVINEMGISFIYRLKDETGAHDPDIVRAYTVCRKIFEAVELRKEINALSGLIESNVLYKMTQEVNRLVRRAVRWFLRNRGMNLPIEDSIRHFVGPVKQVSDALPSLLRGHDIEMDTMSKSLQQDGVLEPLAQRISGLSAMFSALDIVEAALLYKFPVDEVAAVYYAIGRRLYLDWFREVIKKHPISNHWEALARATFRDDLDRQQRNVTISILKSNTGKYSDITTLIEHWLKRHTLLVERWEYFVAELKSTPEPDFTMFSVALRELLDMTYVSGAKAEAINK